jgi:uncharacterized OB-fold protein
MKRGPPPSSVESRGADSDVERNRRLQQVDIGLPVAAVLRPRRQRKGSLLDIRYFKPVAS